LPPQIVSSPDFSMWMVWSRDSAAVPPARRFHQRANAGKHAQDIAARGLPCQIKRGGREDEIDLLLQRHRLERGAVHRSIGGADQRVAVPWNSEHHAAVAGMRDHDGVLAGQKGAVEDQVHSLAGRDHRRDGGIRLPAQVVGERPRGVDDHLGRRMEFFSAFGVLRDHAVDEAFGVLREAGHAHVVEQGGAQLISRGGHVDRAAGNRRTARRSR
jgi:hypothetical protein